MPSSLSSRQVVEVFHLVFVRALSAGTDKGLIALKGGCNLRFYFGSVRYSEDIDLDVIVIAKETLKNKVDRLLKSPAVTAPLKSKGISIAEISAPKQTDVTQRWKVGLSADWVREPFRTKIEFSRRDAIDGAVFEATDREVLRPYGLTPVLALHYGAPAAAAQKIRALAHRTEPQARDLFDLSLLLSREDAAPIPRKKSHAKDLELAIENAMSISYDEHKSKVVAFLDPDHAATYGDRATWTAMQDDVVRRLEDLR